MNLAKELEARGLIADKTAELSEILEKPRTVYLGVDPTADSMQAGNLAVIIFMKRLASAGHKLIFLVGGATGMIGDPKEKGERSLLEKKTLASNTRVLKKQLKGILGKKTPFTMVDNADWLARVKLLPFLRDIGKHFTVNDLIKRDIIRKRLETPDESISYTEFTYALLQGYDYMTLNKKYGCDLQVGGSDQWTNILSGVDLIRKKTGKQVHALSIPLVTDATGKKFGKSEGNAIWLSPKKTSPFAFYQFWINLPDEGLSTYLKYYTFLSPIEIDMLIALHEKRPDKRLAQTKLAMEVTELVHGAVSAKASFEASAVLFGRDSIDSISREARDIIIAEAPTLKVDTDTTIIDALTESGLTASKGEARRIMGSKGVSLGGAVIEEDRTLTKEDFSNSIAILKKGKRDLRVLILK